MDADDASSAEMRRRHDPHTDPLALDEEAAERLLSGQLSPDQAPPGYAEVAALLAATAAPPTPEELAGKAAALAELRAVTRARVAGSRRAARPPRRRRRFGLAAVVVVGALVTGGVAAAATGHLPAPVREAARSVLDTGGRAEPAPRTSPGPAAAPSSSSTPGSSAATGQSSPPTGATGSGPSTTGAPAPAAPNPELEALCQSYLSGNGAEKGKKLESAAFQALVSAAGGKDKVEGYCQRLLPEDKTPKEKKQPAPTDDPGPGQRQGPGGPPPSNGEGSSGQGNRADARL
jgi:hypothetical protein